MSILPQLIPIELGLEKRQQIVLTNITKMLTNRGLLNKSDLEKNIKKITSEQNDTHEYTISLDNPKLYYKESETTNKMIVKLYYHKLGATISKSSPLGDFLNSGKDTPKLIVVTAASNKVREQVKADYPNAEIFLEKELLINIVDHVAVPLHQLLTDEESKAVLNEYEVKKKELPRIYVTDPIARYYNARVGKMFRIIRPSETAVDSPYIRLVIKGFITP
jgi:DNA-directed RNA polymerase subunit H (RpoH/RPB5)